jgi:hypothetical protein
VFNTLIIDASIIVLLEDIKLGCLYEGMKATEVGVRVVGFFSPSPIHCCRSIHLALSSPSASRVSMVGNVVQLEKCLTAISRADSRAFLDEMRGEAIDSTFGKSLATGLARVLVSVAGVVQFGTSSEMLKNQCCKTTLAQGLQDHK